MAPSFRETNKRNSRSRSSSSSSSSSSNSSSRSSSSSSKKRRLSMQRQQQHQLHRPIAPAAAAAASSAAAAAALAAASSAAAAAAALAAAGAAAAVGCPTPYNLNRYVLLLIYILYTLLSSCVYFGWGPLSDLLYRAGVYLWTCTEEEQQAAAAAAAAGAEEADKPACSNQDVDVQRLFNICYACHFTASAAAGLLIDIAGPKVTALLGQALNICGWTLLGYCSFTFRSAVPAFLFIGAGADMTYLPMLCIINLFPGSTGFALSALGASCSLSFAVPLLLRAAADAGVPFRFVCWGYVALGPVICVVLLVLFVPLEGFVEVDLFVLVRSTPYGRTSIGCRSTSRKGAVSAILRYNNSSKSTSKTGEPARSLRAAAVSVAAERGEEKEEKEGEAEEAQLSSVTDEEFFQPFKKEACTFLYLGICVYFVVCSIAITFYQQAAGKVLKGSAVSAMDFATPFSTIPCLILGRVADFVPIVPIMLFVNTAGLLSFLLVLGGTVPFSWLSIACFSVYLSFFTSQVYIFIHDMFTSVHFGKLIGVASMLGGMLSLVSSLLYNELVRQLGGDARPVVFGLIVLICATYLLLIPIMLKAKQKQKEINALHFFNNKADSRSRSSPAGSVHSEMSAKRAAAGLVQ
ncbi:hypothetical protein Efla_006053 [Eimeria flavescens]